ncbi:MAG: ATP-binding cassette domain-containing protein [Deltaproteobacteria bacterium]|nr:ATP-binding cassette domain-containing protein [Deltaproteobacteria bacterium]
MAAAVRLERVRYRYPGCAWVLQDVELGIDAGEYAVVFGANGSGKSSSAYLLNGLIPHFFGGTLQGEVRVDGLSTRDHATGDLFSRVGLVLQNPDAQLFSSTVADELAFGLESLGLPARQIEERILATAAALGIQTLLARSPETLSGGEQRLVAIASVLVMDPPLLVLDEPFANLDWIFARRLKSLLADLRRRRKTVIVIEHRTGDFLQDATRLAVFENGRCFHAGPAAAFRRILEKHRLVPAYPALSCPAVSQTVAPVLAVEHLGFSIGEKKILEDVSFALRPGEVVALVGKNGAGKSTLVRHLIGLLKPLSGDMFLHGRSIRDQAPSELARSIGVCFQNPNDQFFKTTVRDELEVGLRRRRVTAGDGIGELCRRFRLGGLLDRSPYRLSEGGKKQVAISAVMAMDPEVLVLDEPTVSQDAAGKEALAAWIGELAGQGIAVLVATHDLDFAAACAARWVLLDEGHVRGDGAAADITRLMGAESLEPVNPPAGGNVIPSRPARSSLNPLTRLVLLLAGVGAVLASHSTAALTAEAAGAAILLLSCRERQVRSLRLMGPMVALVFVLGIVFFDMATALSLVLRVFSLLGISAVAFASLHPEELGASLAELKIPPGPAFMLTAGLRYVPLIEQKILSIRDAQQARGIDLRPRLTNLGNWMALLLPLLVQCFLLADELALAMEARGFSSKSRTPRRAARLGSRDWAVMVAALCVLTLLICWERG